MAVKGEELKRQLVYKYTNLINNKSYIGITCKQKYPNARWRNGYGYKYNKKFFEDIEKQGWKNFSHEILERDLTQIEASKKETQYIRFYDTIKNGYNLLESDGGGLTEEVRKTISKKLTGIKRSQKTINLQMQTKHYRQGDGKSKNYCGPTKKVRCIETGDVFLSIADAERWSGTPKIAACCNHERKHAGHHPVTKELLSWEWADENAEVTIFCSEKTNILKEQKTLPTLKVKCIETNKIYFSLVQAEKETGINACNISRVCRGIRKTAGNLHWCFLKEDKE